jgi:hypothetical protein
MIQIKEGDLIAVAAAGKYYYALVLDRVRLFGGNWTFVFHKTSSELLAADQILTAPHEGFHAFVDFIWSKRENRVSRIARNVELGKFQGPSFLKQSSTIKGKATFWFISDMTLKEIRRTTCLSEAERKYPLKRRIDDIIMVSAVEAKWKPEHDERI